MADECMPINCSEVKKIINIIIYFNYYIFTLLYEPINLNLIPISSSVNGYKMIKTLVDRQNCVQLI